MAPECCAQPMAAVQSEPSSVSITYLAPIASPSGSGKRISYRILSDHSLANASRFISLGITYFVNFSYRLCDCAISGVGLGLDVLCRRQADLLAEREFFAGRR